LWSLNLLELQGPIQACSGKALPFLHIQFTHGIENHSFGTTDLKALNKGYTMKAMGESAHLV
jgi:hypothetical protein